MHWMFWKPKPQDPVLQGMEQMDQRFTDLANQIRELTEKTAEQEDQIRKLSRLQFKTGQETTKKTEQLQVSMDRLAQLYQQLDEGKRWQHQATAQWSLMVERTVCLLDELDHASTTIEADNGQGWGRVLQGWAGELLTTLAELGLRPYKAKGQTFEPRTMEAIGTVSLETSIQEFDVRPEEAIPYMVVAVIRRGFRTEDGKLYRKAQVITIEEEQHETDNPDAIRTCGGN